MQHSGNATEPGKREVTNTEPPGATGIQDHRGSTEVQQHERAPVAVDPNRSEGRESLGGNENRPASSSTEMQAPRHCSASSDIEATALMWLQRAAKDGHAKALYALGLRYQDGRGGLRRNLEKAIGCFRKAARRGIITAEERAETCETMLRWERDPAGMERAQRKMGKRLLQESFEAQRSRDIKNRLIFPGAQDQTYAREVFSEAIKQAHNSKERMRSFRSFVKKLQPRLKKGDLRDEAPDVGYDDDNKAFVRRAIDSEASDYMGPTSDDSSRMAQVRHVGIDEALKVDDDDPFDARIRKSILKSIAKVDPARLKKRQEKEEQREREIEERHRRIAAELDAGLESRWLEKRREPVDSRSGGAEIDAAFLSDGSRTILSCAEHQESTGCGSGHSMELDSDCLQPVEELADSIGDLE